MTRKYEKIKVGFDGSSFAAVKGKLRQISRDIEGAKKGQIDPYLSSNVMHSVWKAMSWMDDAVWVNPKHREKDLWKQKGYIISREVLERLGLMEKRANYMQRGGGSIQGADERQPGYDYRGTTQRNIDTDLRGTYLAGGKEDRRSRSYLEKKRGLKIPKGRSNHNHMRRDPALDTASSASDTWSGITEGTADGEVHS